MSKARIKKDGGVTGDWHPVFKALREQMVSQNVSWHALEDATGVSYMTLLSSFGGKNNIQFAKLEMAANALGYHLALVPMTQAELDALGNGEYNNPGVVQAAAQCNEAKQ